MPYLLQGVHLRDCLQQTGAEVHVVEEQIPQVRAGGADALRVDHDNAGSMEVQNACMARRRAR
jgi:hypothetical protein